jgi:hypothetical protein
VTPSSSFLVVIPEQTIFQTYGQWNRDLDEGAVRKICLGSECHCLAAYINQSAGTVVWPRLKRDLAVERKPQLASFFDEHETVGLYSLSFCVEASICVNSILINCIMRGEIGRHCELLFKSKCLFIWKRGFQALLRELKEMPAGPCSRPAGKPWRDKGGLALRQ